MVKIEVAPVYAIACDAAMAIALRYACLALQTTVVLLLPLLFLW
jgi:hypothetical protein